MLVVAFSIVLLRLAQMQLLQGAAYRQLAEQNRLRVVPEPAPRGLILDRLGRRLATTRIVFQVAAVPQDLPSTPRASAPHRLLRGVRPAPRSGLLREAVDRQTVFARLGPVVGLTSLELERRFNEQLTLPFLPATLLTHVPKATALRLEEAHLLLPGIVVEPVAMRDYPLGTAAAHLLGYVGQPSEETFATLKQYGVHPQDLVGRTGLEQQLDAELRGHSGGSLIEVDHRARQVQTLGHREPTPGQPVTLTIDARLQQLIAHAFGQQSGAAVVLRPQTGELLAMVSVPAFEPEAFATQDQLAIRGLLADPRSPLMNRAADGLYLPGSIVKPVIAATALEQGVMAPRTAIHCPGSLTIGDRVFHCWKRDGHGLMTMREALLYSCNVYFLEVGRRLGRERLRAGYLGVGFGRRTGWSPDEQAGHLPFGRHLTEGEVAMLAIGQGEILITPLQAAVMVSAIANGGWLVEPWVVKTTERDSTARAHASSVGWSAATLATIREGMLAVINDPHGTGIRAHSETVRIAGKTGTAQTHKPGQTHGWFIGFCPAEQPVAALAIVAEYGGSGGDLPASIGKAVCEYLMAQDASSATSPTPTSPAPRNL